MYIFWGRYLNNIGVSNNNKHETASKEKATPREEEEKQGGEKEKGRASRIRCLSLGLIRFNRIYLFPTSTTIYLYPYTSI